MKSAVTSDPTACSSRQPATSPHDPLTLQGRDFRDVLCEIPTWLASVAGMGQIYYRREVDV